MALAYDAFSTAASGAGTLSWTHTPSGTPAAIVVFINQRGGTGDAVSGVTYGGVAMTRVENASEATESTAGYTYVLLSGVPTGAQTVVVTVSSASVKKGYCYSTTGTGGVPVVEATANFTSASTATATATLSTTASTETFCSAALASGRNAPDFTPDGTLTQADSSDEGNQSFAVARRTSNPSGGSVSMTWTQIADDAVIVAVALREDPAPPVATNVVRVI